MSGGDVEALFVSEKLWRIGAWTGLLTAVSRIDTVNVEDSDGAS